MRAEDKAQVMFQELGDFVRESMQLRNVPGVALGAVFDGREFLAGFGVTSVNNPLPVDGDTLFQIGSTTKTVTATLAMILARQGKLDLDLPLRKYLPDLKLADEEATACASMRHLLTHTGGWSGDFFDDTGSGDDALARYVAKMADLPQVTPLGETYSYSNSGFCLAGRVIEAIAGATYEKTATEMVLRPLGMAQSSFFPAEVMLSRFAAGHAVNEGKASVSRPWPIPRASNPAGGISSSAREQLRYARFHMGDGSGADGSRVLAPESLAAMQDPHADGPLDRKQGLAWILRDVRGARLVLHGGATNGQQSAFLMAPDAGFAIAVLTNSSTGGRVHTDLVKLALKLYLGVDDADPRPIEAGRETLAEFTGRYQGFMGDIEIKLDDEGLSLSSLPRESAGRLSEAVPQPQTFRIAPCAADRFVVTSGLAEGAEAELLRDKAGAVAFLRYGLRVYPRLPE